MEININISDIPINNSDQFSEWNESNPCFGCGNCCNNVRIPLGELSNPSHSNYFGELAPFVVNPEEPMELQEFLKQKLNEHPGVYYIITKRGNRCLEIIGDCPGLNTEERSCDFHDKERPYGCISSGLDSIKCITNRKE